MTRLAQKWWAQGASVELVTNTVPQLEHAVSADRPSRLKRKLVDAQDQAEEECGIAGVMQFFQDRFDGAPFAKGCTYKSDLVGIQIPTITNTSVTDNIY